MKSLGYVAQEGESEKYSLTLKLFELGARALQNVDLVRSADIQMRELSRLTKETIHLGALDEDSIVYIHKIDSMYNLRMYSRIGRRNPLYSTAIGKVLLAWRDRSEVEQILEGVEYKRSTERTITSTEALLKVLDGVREQGYGEDNEEQEEGLRCIGVPVFDRFGVVIAGLSISSRRYVSQKNVCMNMWRCCIRRRARFLSKWDTTTTRSDAVAETSGERGAIVALAGVILTVINHGCAFAQNGTVTDADHTAVGMHIKCGTDPRGR